LHTIDQMTADDASTAALQRARQFYERLLEHEAAPARSALIHYRLARVHERLGDHRAAEFAYQEAISRWEELARNSPHRDDFEIQIHESRQRLQALGGR